MDITVRLHGARSRYRQKTSCRNFIFVAQAQSLHFRAAFALTRPLHHHLQRCPSSGRSLYLIPLTQEWKLKENKNKHLVVLCHQRPSASDAITSSHNFTSVQTRDKKKSSWILRYDNNIMTKRTLADLGRLGSVFALANFNAFRCDNVLPTKVRNASFAIVHFQPEGTSSI